MKSATRTFLSLTEIEPRIVPDATATLLPETFGSTTTTATTLQYADDPAHPVTTTTLGFTDDPAHSVTATPVNTTIPLTTPTPPADTAPSAGATPEVLALPPEFLAWIETLSDAEIQSLLELSDAELGALIAGTSAPESPATPVAGPSLPIAITPTLHGVDVGTSPPPPAADPNVVNTVYHIDPNAPPPTATTLEFRDGQQQGPAVTLAGNPAQTPPITPPQPAINPPQIVVGNAPPVVQAAAPAVLLLNNPAIGIITSGGTWPGPNQMIYTQDADGTLHEYITTSMLEDMIARGNAASSGIAAPTGFWNAVGDWIPFNESIPYIVGTVTSGFVWDYIYNDTRDAARNVREGFVEGFENVIIDPVVNTYDLAHDIAYVFVDPEYTPQNEHLIGYLNGDRTHGGAVVSITADALTVLGLGSLVRGALGRLASLRPAPEANSAGAAAGTAGRTILTRQAPQLETAPDWSMAAMARQRPVVTQPPRGTVTAPGTTTPPIAGAVPPVAVVPAARTAEQIAAESAARTARSAPAPTNHRGRYMAERNAQGRSRLPDDWDVHHSIPQEYMGRPDFANFDFHHPSNLRGVRGSRADVNVHQTITNEWAEFGRLHPDATRAEIEEFARQIDLRYAAEWF